MFEEQARPHHLHEKSIPPENEYKVIVWKAENEYSLLHFYDIVQKAI